MYFYNVSKTYNKDTKNIVKKNTTVEQKFIKQIYYYNINIILILLI